MDVWIDGVFCIYIFIIDCFSNGLEWCLHGHYLLIEIFNVVIFLPLFYSRGVLNWTWVCARLSHMVDEKRVEFSLSFGSVCVCVLPFYLNNGLSTKKAEYGARIHHQSMWLPGEWRFWSGLGRLYCIFYKKNRVANTSTERERDKERRGQRARSKHMSR